MYYKLVLAPLQGQARKTAASRTMRRSDSKGTTDGARAHARHRVTIVIRIGCCMIFKSTEIFLRPIDIGAGEIRRSAKTTAQARIGGGEDVGNRTREIFWRSPERRADCCGCRRALRPSARTRFRASLPLLMKALLIESGEDEKASAFPARRPAWWQSLLDADRHERLEQHRRISLLLLSAPEIAAAADRDEGDILVRIETSSFTK